MNPQKLMGVNLSSLDRKSLEQTADLIEVMARGVPDDAIFIDQGNNEQRVKDWLFGEAWDMKQLARWGTPSFGI